VSPRTDVAGDDRDGRTPFAVPISPAPAHESPGWSFRAGDEMVPGLHAWARLGGGPRCETWLAWSTRHWCPVAAKVARPAESDHSQTARRLAEEAGRVTALSHPAFQRLLEDLVHGRPPCLLYEYAEGPTLASLVDRHGPMEPAEVALVGIQLASALRYLHAEGLVHLDLKPTNLVLRDGRVVVLDLGLSRPVGAGGGRRLRGTPRYMAPEQRAGAAADPGMDVYALGLVLHELLTGAPAGPPAGDGELQRVIASLLHHDPAHRPSINAALSALALVTPSTGPDAPWPGWVSDLAVRLSGSGSDAPRTTPPDGQRHRWSAPSRNIDVRGSADLT